MDVLKIKNFWKIFKQNKLGVVGLIILLIFVFLAIFAPLLARFPSLTTGAGEAFLNPSFKHLLGTDNLGRDLYSELLFGARITLVVSFIAVITSTVVGVLFGSIAGYYGGIIDSILMRITEIFLVIPPIFLALVLVAIFGANITNMIIVISVLSWPQTARLVRAEILSLKERPYCKAAIATGASDFKIIFSELVPNTMTTIIVNLSLTQATAILIESALSFLGFGDSSMVSWGLMLNNAQEFFRQSWFMVFFPGMSIFLVVLSLNLVGEGLNDVFNPRRKK
ncbi:MAG: ABC transporter permease [Pelagibacteraceae bacterium]|jgi:peptide/nickel transport system permease protein|nr:ABC transporter permease [Pelagibacteraceae bacterium]|tara:strand:- start:2853 stop:3695 length:843 start_codon:yes stop_codon:yes gene_type:complete